MKSVCNRVLATRNPIIETINNGVGRGLFVLPPSRLVGFPPQVQRRGAYEFRLVENLIIWANFRSNRDLEVTFQIAINPKPEGIKRLQEGEIGPKVAEFCAHAYLWSDFDGPTLFCGERYISKEISRILAKYTQIPEGFEVECPS